MSDFDLTRYLPYLVNRTGIRIAAAFAEEFKAHGITLQMWRVLAALDHADGQRISDLAALTSIDVSTLSRILDQMQDRDFIERRRGNGRSRDRGADARVVTVHSTVQGRTVTAALIPRARHYEAVALTGFSKAEGEALKGMLGRIYDNIALLEAENDKAEKAA